MCTERLVLRGRYAEEDAGGWHTPDMDGCGVRAGLAGDAGEVRRSSTMRSSSSISSVS